MLRSHPWADVIKAHSQVNLIKITETNRDTAVQLVLDSLSKDLTLDRISLDGVV